MHGLNQADPGAIDRIDPQRIVPPRTGITVTI